MEKTTPKTAKAGTIEAPKTTEVKANAKKTEAKQPVKSATSTKAKTTTVKKTTAKPAAKKPEAKKPIAAKPAAAKTAAKETIYVQFMGKELDTGKLADEAKKLWKEDGNNEAVKSMELYIKTEEHAVYYVINDVAGKFSI